MSSWIYNLIRYEGKIRLCELYNLDTTGHAHLFFLPVSWVNLLKYPKMVINDLLYQRRKINIIPEGEFLNEQITERIRYE